MKGNNKSMKRWINTHTKQVVVIGILVAMLAAILIVGIVRTTETGNEKLKETPATGKVYSTSSDVTIDLSSEGQ
jgi:hypothetical protein